MIGAEAIIVKDSFKKAACSPIEVASSVARYRCISLMDFTTRSRITGEANHIALPAMAVSITATNTPFHLSKRQPSSKSRSGAMTSAIRLAVAKPKLMRNSAPVAKIVIHQRPAPFCLAAKAA
jgi:hypothetical protein